MNLYLLVLLHTYQNQLQTFMYYKTLTQISHMKRCPRCLHGELTDLKDLYPIMACDYCDYRCYNEVPNCRKWYNILLNTRYKFNIYYKKIKIYIALSLANLMYIVPMSALYIVLAVYIGFVFWTLNLLTPAPVTYIAQSRETIKMTALVTFFIMLGVVDLSILVLHRYVYEHINNLISDLNKLAPGYFSDPREDFIKSVVENEKDTKLYPERLLIFGVVIILLEFFSILLPSHYDQDLKMILVGISMVLISIGIWKYLSFKADDFGKKPE